MLKRSIENVRVAWRSPRWRRALVVAAISDALGFSVVVLGPAVWLLDAATVFLLLKVLGFRWQLLFALGIEAIPILEVFPAWTLVVLALAAADSNTPER